MRRSFLTLSARAISMIFFLALPTIAAAMPFPSQDADDEVFSATQVLVVSHAQKDDYRVEETFLGSLKPAETVTLPGFRLFHWERMVGGPDEVPITPQTRILLFLRPAEANDKQLTVTDYGNAYAYRDAEKVGELRDKANHAIAVRNTWGKAAATEGGQVRLEALWPYVLDIRHPTCRKLTLKELVKLNPLPGDYLAEHLATTPPGQRGELMLLSGEFPTEKLHRASIAIVTETCRVYEEYVAAHHLDHAAIVARIPEGSLPASISCASGDVYYGLSAIRSYKDKRDMPFFRGIVPRLMHNRFDQAQEECAAAMEAFPAPENLPVLKAMWEDYKTWRATRQEDQGLAIPLANALTALKSAETLAILKEMLQDPTAHNFAEGGIRSIEKAKK